MKGLGRRVGSMVGDEFTDNFIDFFARRSEPRELRFSGLHSVAVGCRRRQSRGEKYRRAEATPTRISISPAALVTRILHPGSSTFFARSAIDRHTALVFCSAIDRVAVIVSSPFNT
jgi:hypothetical protein